MGEGGRENQWKKTMTGMINEEDKVVDPYLPRKCEYTNRILHAKDKSSIQVNICDVDEEGRLIKNSNTTVVLSGFIRQKGLGAMALDKVLTEKGVLPIKE